MFKPIGSLIYKLPNRSKAEGVITALRIRQVAKEAIERELVDFPKEVLSVVKVKSFKNGVLVVNATSMVSTELHMRASSLIDDINKGVGSRLLTKIVFKTS